jgi:hypothetical protein
VIVIGTTRKPTQRIRSFIKELNRVLPNSTRLTRGKQGFNEFCDIAHDLGATRILLVGAFHGNPGRLGFLRFLGESWGFQPPTIIIKSTRLLREYHVDSPQKIKKLYVVPDTPRDNNKAEMLAYALGLPCTKRDSLSTLEGKVAIVRVAYIRYKSIDFLSPDEKHPLGPSMLIKHFLTRPMGDQKRW